MTKRENTNRHISKYEHMTIEQIELAKLELMEEFENMVKELKTEQDFDKRYEIHSKCENLDREISVINKFYIIKLKNYIKELENMRGIND